MRTLLAALALAGALLPRAVDAAPRMHVAQMSRDVVAAVRQQRADKHQPCAPCGCVGGRR